MHTQLTEDQERERNERTRGWEAEAEGQVSQKPEQTEGRDGRTCWKGDRARSPLSSAIECGLNRSERDTLADQGCGASWGSSGGCLRQCSLNMARRLFDHSTTRSSCFLFDRSFSTGYSLKLFTF